MINPRLLAGAAAVAVASTLVAPVPADAATTGARRYIVHAGGCSGAILNTPSGSWIVTAAHCGAVRTVTTYNSHVFRVVQRMSYGSATPTGDVMLLRVRGNAKAAVGGGFALGGTPANGSLVNVNGYPSGRAALAGCRGLRVHYAYGRYPQVTHCYLPSGTSGGPWWTNDVVLRGVVGGLDRGGNSDWTTNAAPFSSSVRSWIRNRIY